MSRIQLLSDTLASQVAAGEVIERPASVVKELVENSLDAQARSIEVMIRRGGISLIRVTDDGVGMDRDDALLCLERHATSKIRSAADLATVETLGFRGEALPSIASVARFRLTTREKEAVAGSEIIVSGGKIETVRDGGEAPGTQVEVRSLFYNLPARRKFLRSENTETRNIEHQLYLQAFAHPEVAYSFVRDDKVVFQLPATRTLRDRIRDLLGNELLARLIEVEPAPHGKVVVSGFIGQAGVSRASRTQQFVFVNGRAIESALLGAALKEGYHTALMKGQYPVTFLFLRIAPAEVDVNVHPAKREVRFRDPNGVREAVVASIRRTLSSDRESWQEQFRAPASESVVAAAPSRPVFPVPNDAEQTRLPVEIAPPSPGDDFQPNEQRAPAGKHEFRILGILNKLYVLMENAEGLVLVDQHAAHERILFEELRRRIEAKGVPSQRLLLPQIIELAPRDAEWLERNLGTLRKMGLGVEEFGRQSFKLESLPPFLSGADPARLLQDVIDGLKSASRAASPARLGEEMIAKTVCRHAVKANDYLRNAEVEKLIRDLLDCELPYCCPHGRPTMIQISLGELEKKFGRKV
ncbi:MAG TPA: DNA mismatch repair endonuclease MutL [Chthoniobacterales bacterium]|nr:DNA mismatch repair endonuclease MutL [Chthoniobacterales bacterium]